MPRIAIQIAARPLIVPTADGRQLVILEEHIPTVKQLLQQIERSENAVEALKHIGGVARLAVLDGSVEIDGRWAPRLG